MSRDYLKHIASVLHDIDYKDHVVQYDADLIYNALKCQPLDIEIDILVEEHVKMNMIEGYDRANKVHRKLEYHDMFDTHDDYFKEFVIKNSNDKIFQMINNRIHIKHMYVKKFYTYIKESSYRHQNCAAELVAVQCKFEFEDRSIYWLFDQNPSRVEVFHTTNKLKIQYRKKQVDAFQKTIGDSLCFDLVDLVSRIVLQDSPDDSESDSDSD